MRGYAVIGCHGLSKIANYGGILRAAHCFNADLIILEGGKFIKDASNTTDAHKHIPIILGDILQLKPHGCHIVVVEITNDAIDLASFIHPERALYVFGSEGGSVPKRIIEKASYVVKVNTQFCMNLAATANVVLYDRLAKQTLKFSQKRYNLPKEAD